MLGVPHDPLSEYVLSSAGLMHMKLAKADLHAGEAGKEKVCAPSAQPV